MVGNISCLKFMTKLENLPKRMAGESEVVIEKNF